MNGAGVQYVGAPVVGVEGGRGVGLDVGAAVSSSRRAPSRRPLDRRAFGPLRGGRCPPTTALRNKHRHRQAIMRTTAAPSSTIWDELRHFPPPRCALGGPQDFRAELESSDGKASTTRIARPTTGSERSTRAFFIVRQKTLRGTIRYTGTILRYPDKRQEKALVSAGYRSTSWYASCAQSQSSR